MDALETVRRHRKATSCLPRTTDIVPTAPGLGPMSDRVKTGEAHAEQMSSAVYPITDSGGTSRHVRKVPRTDIPLSDCQWLCNDHTCRQAVFQRRVERCEAEPGGALFRSSPKQYEEGITSANADQRQTKSTTSANKRHHSITSAARPSNIAGISRPSRGSQRQRPSLGTSSARKPGENREEQHVVEEAEQDLHADDELRPSGLGRYVAIACRRHGYDAEIERIAQIEFG
jgi:hypothetical protein